jgi:hypothetical protein
MPAIDFVEVTEEVTMGDLFERLGVDKVVPDKCDELLSSDTFGIEIESLDGFYPIEALRMTKPEDTVRLSLRNGDRVDASPEHVVLTLSNDDVVSWKQVKDIDIQDDSVMTRSGFVKTSEMSPLDRVERLYDLQVSTVHSYYTNNVLSHNSHFLTELGCNALRHKLNVLHYTFELSEAKTGIRYDSNLCDIDSNDVVDNKEKLRKMYEEMRPKLGKLIIKFYPSGTPTVHTLRAHIEKLSLKGFKPDLVLIDYADIMKSSRQYDSLRHEMKLVYTELRGLAEELDVALWSACFHGDTVISSPFGDFKIKDKVGQSGFPVYSYNHDTKRLELRTVKSVYKSGENVEVWKVKLDNGKEVIVTPNHKFMKRDGSYCEVKDLNAGDSLMPFEQRTSDGERCVYRNNGAWESDSILINEWLNNTTTQINECLVDDLVNHKVVSVEPCGFADVYNMEVDELHNYALDAGIVVKNSQSNKEGSVADVIDLGNASEAYGKTFIADFVCTISRKSFEKATGAARLYVAKNRAGVDGILYPVQMNTARSKFVLSEMRENIDSAKQVDEQQYRKALREKLSRLTKENLIKDVEQGNKAEN